MFGNGQGVSQDYAEAIKWFRLAAVQGDADAQYSLGRRYYNGEGVAKDYAEAAKWFRLGAEQGHAGAQYALGVMFNLGSNRFLIFRIFLDGQVESGVMRFRPVST